MQIIRSSLFNKFPEIIFGFSTKIGLGREAPFYFNLSFTVGDKTEIVKENREHFFNGLGLTSNQIVYQKQIHSDIITDVQKPGLIGDSDGMITRKLNIGLAISSADCTPIFIYDSQEKVVAAVHSGWRGTKERIVEKAISKMMMDYSSQSKNLFVYVGPSISQLNYEVGKEVADLFDNSFITERNGRLFLDVVGANLKMIERFGIEKTNIEVSPLCSFHEKELLHSYRRDKNLSGRSLGVIAIKGA